MDTHLPETSARPGPAGRPCERGGKPWRRFAVPLLALSACVAGLAMIEHVSAAIDYRTVVRTVMHLGPEAVALSVLATVLSYLALIGRDRQAVRHLGVRLRPATLVVGAVAGSALGNMIGLGALTGGAVRYRVYGTDGMGPGAVARLTVLTAASFGLALVFYGGLGTLLAAGPMAALSGLPQPALQATGAVALLVTFAAIALCGRERRPLGWRRLRLDLPERRFVLGQIAWTGLDVLGAGLSLWVLLPASGVSFATFLAVYTAALLLGVIGHTPGGVGVFEAALLFVLGSTVPPSETVAALVVYRAIYFVAPLLVSAALLAGFEARGMLPRLRAVRWPAVPRLLRLEPLLLGPVFISIITFAVGVMLVVSGATPALGRRLAVLATVLPLWALEAANLLASVLGVVLLFVVRGLFMRLDGAWWLAIVVTSASLVLALAKGLAFGECALLTFLLGLLMVSRGSFTRPSALFDQQMTLAWSVTVVIVLLVAGWMYLFAFRHVPYSNDLFWSFAFDEKAPRALRATLAATLFAGFYMLWQALRPARGRVVRPSAADLAEAARIVGGQERSDAMLAMMGDKSFLFSPSRRAFLMYARRGRSWVALYDPIGPREEWQGLIAAFVQLAHAHDGRAAFYQVRPDSLPLYLDAGLKLMKLGEEARIDLRDFRLEGSKQTHLRYALRRGERDGLTCEVIGPEGMAAVLPTLRAISDAWLQQRNAREKGFSVAAFDPAWLASHSVMLVRQHGVAVGFVTFMTTNLVTEATVGIMRHAEAASPYVTSHYVMEFLFIRLALHLKAAGFSCFSLGMAPLSGMAPTPLASWWHRIGHLLWQHGGRLYNFRGLRSFKGKFGPQWEPRYLAASGVFGPFLSLADVAALSNTF